MIPPACRSGRKGILDAKTFKMEADDNGVITTANFAAPRIIPAGDPSSIPGRRGLRGIPILDR